jgi:hypothetical protein
MDSPLALFFLGLLAVAASVQTLLLVTLTLQARRLAARVESVERELPPHLERLSQILSDAAVVATAARRQVPRIEAALDDTLDKVQRTTDAVEHLALAPLRPVARALALWRGLQRGALVYRQLKGFGSRR